MCGICGYIARERLTNTQLSNMNNSMMHRGPDDEGIETIAIGNEWYVGLGHRRLSIIDLSRNGHQPMKSADGDIYIVFNGEIYNHKYLRKELAGYPYKSDSDTEVIIAAYLRWGRDDFVSHLNGMFVFALYDRKKQELILARDRVGKKPIYYWLGCEKIVFGSELKTIMSYPGFSGKIKKGILARYLANQYINAPDTIFDNVYKLEPGTFMMVNLGEGLKAEVRVYWKLSDVYAMHSENMVIDYESARQELKSRIVESVRDRMVADVPVGFFLSGGYDSSLVTAVAASVSMSPIKTYSIGFQEKTLDEADYARQVAKFIGSCHTEKYISESEMLELVEKIPTYYDEPFADSSQIPTMLVSMLAAQDVKVVLTGDGGDEFFCGYSRYDNVRIAQSMYPASVLFYRLGQVAPRLLERMPRKLRVLSQVAGNKEWRTQILMNEYERMTYALIIDKRQRPLRYPIESTFSTENWQEINMLVDIATYLPGDILCKVDRASMMYSLEARCPLLDKRVIEYSFSLPHKYKYNNGKGKRILKDIVYDYIPRVFLDREKKGFGVPLERWIKGPLRERLIEACDKKLITEQGIFDYYNLTKLMERYFSNSGDVAERSYITRLLWSILIFQNWYRQYISKISVLE